MRNFSETFTGPAHNWRPHVCCRRYGPSSRIIVLRIQCVNEIIRVHNINLTRFEVTRDRLVINGGRKTGGFYGTNTNWKSSL